MLLKILFLFTVITIASAHFRFQYPPARNTNPGLKTYPCGGDDFWGTGQIITSVAPGTLTIRLEETITHAGAPFRVALSYDSDDHYDDLILLDHIPHNDAGAAPKIYYIEVEIPDIDCPKCSLQVVNPMTDKIAGSSCCAYPEGTTQCQSVYHSCANIEITGTGSLEKWVKKYQFEGVCGPYTQESGGVDVWEPHLTGHIYNPDGEPTIATECEGIKEVCGKSGGGGGGAAVVIILLIIIIVGAGAAIMFAPPLAGVKASLLGLIGK